MKFEWILIGSADMNYANPDEYIEWSLYMIYESKKSYRGCIFHSRSDQMWVVNSMIGGIFENSSLKRCANTLVERVKNRIIADVMQS